MDIRVGLSIFLLLIGGRISAARSIEETEKPLKAAIISSFPSRTHEKTFLLSNAQVCKLCEQLASDTFTYLSSNNTQTQIIEALLESCSNLGSFRKKCTALVDYYAHMFFIEIGSSQPEAFCNEIDLCEQMVHYFEKMENRCDACRHAISEVTEKLNDPDIEVEIIELLLKACNSIKSYTAKCKKVVFEYGPIILANARKFLENTDICTVLRVCSARLDADA